VWKDLKRHYNYEDERLLNMAQLLFGWFLKGRHQTIFSQYFYYAEFFMNLTELKTGSICSKPDSTALTYFATFLMKLSGGLHLYLHFLRS